MYTESPNTSWLVFNKGTTWIAKFLKPNFGHVCILQKDEFNWLVLDPQPNNLKWTILPYGEKEDVPHIIRNQNHHVIKVITYDLKHQSPKWFYMWANCLTVVKYMAGIRGFYMTPYSLYKALIKMESRNRFKHGVISVVHLR